MSSGDTESSIEWRTYTPDGRVLRVERKGPVWTAACDGAEAHCESLADAIRQAVAAHDQKVTPIVRPDAALLESWARETAGHIEGDSETPAA